MCEKNHNLDEKLISISTQVKCLALPIYFFYNLQDFFKNY